MRRGEADWWGRGRAQRRLLGRVLVVRVRLVGGVGGVGVSRATPGFLLVLSATCWRGESV
jgi:hypothetical protein